MSTTRMGGVNPPAKERTRILLLANPANVATSQLKDAFHQDWLQLDVLSPTEDVQAVVTALWNCGYDAIILTDFGLSPDYIPQMVLCAKGRTPQPKVMVVAHYYPPDFSHELIRQGIEEFIAYPAPACSVAASIKKLFAHGQDSGDDIEGTWSAPLSSIHRQMSVEVRNKEGIATREGAFLVRTASRFQSAISIDKEDFKADAKEIIGVMSLAAGHGSSLTITLDGPDANDAAEALEKLFASGFDDGVTTEERSHAVECLKLSDKLHKQGKLRSAIDIAEIGLQYDPYNPYIGAYLERLKIEQKGSSNSTNKPSR